MKDPTEISCVSTPLPQERGALQQSAKKRRAPCRSRHGSSGSSPDATELSAKRLKRASSNGKRQSGSVSTTASTFDRRTEKLANVCPYPTAEHRTSEPNATSRRSLTTAFSPSKPSKPNASILLSPERCRTPARQSAGSSSPTKSQQLTPTPVGAKALSWPCLSLPISSSPLSSPGNSQQSEERALAPKHVQSDRTSPRRSLERESLVLRLDCSTPKVARRKADPSQSDVAKWPLVTPQAPRRPPTRRYTISSGILQCNAQLIFLALEAGEDVNAVTSIWDASKRQYVSALPLLLAIRYGDITVLEALLSGGAVPNSVNELGHTALHLICIDVARCSQLRGGIALQSQRESAPRKLSIEAMYPRRVHTPASLSPARRCIVEPPQSDEWLKLDNFLAELVPDEASLLTCETPSPRHSYEHGNKENACGELDDSETTWLDDTIDLVPSLRVEGTCCVGPCGRRGCQNAGMKCRYDRSPQQGAAVRSSIEKESIAKAQVLLAHGTDASKKDLDGKIARDYINAMIAPMLDEVLRRAALSHSAASTKKDANSRLLRAGHCVAPLI